MSGIVFKPPEWGVTHSAADNTVSTIAKAAETLGIHYVTGITVSLSGAANAAAAPVTFSLSDGATVIWTVKLSNIINESETVQLAGLNLRGTKNTAMTLASTQPAASSRTTVAMSGYTEQQTA